MTTTELTVKSKILSPEFRMSFCKLVTPERKPKLNKDKTPMKNPDGSDVVSVIYSVTAIVDCPIKFDLHSSAFPTDEELKASGLTEINALVKLVRQTHNGGKGLPSMDPPIRKGTHKSDQNPFGYDLSARPEYAGKIVFSMKSYGRPAGLGNPDNTTMDPRDAERLFYAGAYADAMITAWAFDVEGNKGVSLGMSSVRWRRHGEPFVSQGDASKDYAGVAAVPPCADNSAEFGELPDDV